MATGWCRNRSCSGATPKSSRRWRAQNGGLGLEHRSRRLPAPIGRTPSISMPASRPAGRSAPHEAIAAGKHVYLEKPIAETLDEAVDAGSRGREGGVRERRRAGQAVPAGLRQDAQRGAVRPARADPCGAARLRLVDLRRDLGAGPAPELELSQEHGRRPRLGYVSALALHHRSSGRRDRGGVVPYRHRDPGTPRRDGSALSCRRRGYGAGDLADRGRRAGSALLLVGDAGEARRPRRAADRRQPRRPPCAGCIAASSRRSDATPRPLWNIETGARRGFRPRNGRRCPTPGRGAIPYAVGWELFLRHVTEGAPFPAPLLAGAKGLQLVEACYRSDRERRWIDLPRLKMKDIQHGTGN